MKENKELSKRAVYFMLLIVLLFFMPGPVQPKQLTILYTNDLHAQYLPRKSGDGTIGGMEALYDLVQRERNGNTLLLDAGDHETGTLLSRLPVDGVLGGGMIEMMNLIGFDATAIGNHEFDNGWENLWRLEALAAFHMLSANLFQNDRLFLKEGSHIFTMNGLKIGVVGLSSADLYRLVFPPSLDDIRIKSVIRTARKTVHELDPLTDLIVLLAHQGFREDSLLAEKVSGVDVIIGGHSHTIIRHPILINGVLVVQAGSRSEYLGRLDLDVENDMIKSFSGQLIPVRNDTATRDSKMAGLVNTYRRRIDKQYGQIIGELKIPWKTSRERESNIGNYFADVMRLTAKADFAVINSGGLRKDLPAGPLRKMDILEVFPFSNRLVRFSCSGRQLLKLIKTNSRASVTKGREILQVSGLKYAARMTPKKAVTILNAEVDGKPIQKNRTYTGVTVDYVVPYNALMYFGFKPDEFKELDLQLSDVMIEFTGKNPNVSSRVEGRMRHER